MVFSGSKLYVEKIIYNVSGGDANLLASPPD